MKPRLRIVAPTTVNRTVTPRRRPNAELRTREYLTETEVGKLIKASSKNRWGHRDATMILVAYRHGLRASELVDLRWDQIDFYRATLAVRRVKSGTPATHPIRGDELRALRRLQREQELKSPFVFTSERGSPFTTSGFARLVERAGEAARLGFPTHPHMLRHACGFALASKGHDTRALQAYLGHKNIQHTVRYTELSPDRFKNFWRTAADIPEAALLKAAAAIEGPQWSRQTATHILFSGEAATMRPRGDHDYTAHHRHPAGGGALPRRGPYDSDAEAQVVAAQLGAICRAVLRQPVKIDMPTPAGRGEQP